MKDQKYVVEGHVREEEDALYVLLDSICVYPAGGVGYRWEEAKREYGEATAALEAEFGKYSECPREEQLGEIWPPFVEHMTLYEMWVSYHEYQQGGTLRFPLEKSGCPSVYALNFGRQFQKLQCVYQGFIAGRILGSWSTEYSRGGIFFLESEWRPGTTINRTDIMGVPLTVLVLIEGILNKYQMYDYNFELTSSLYNENYSLKEWRKIRTSDINKWMNLNLKPFFTERMKFLRNSQETITADRHYHYMADYSNNIILNRYWNAYFQDYYHMTINYEEGQSICFCEKSETETESILDLFPPLLFCKAANDRSRQYICAEDIFLRKGIMIEHPLVKWLLENAILLNQYYERQFQQIVDCLCNKSGKHILNECNNIRQQLIKLPEHHGVDVDNFPVLSMEDFWSTDESR